MQAPSILPPGDPLERFVKSEWDRKFVANPQFLPWLRGQLLIAPIDESVPNPEPLINYVRRRLEIARDNQEAGKVTPGIRPSPASAQPPQSNGTFNHPAIQPRPLAATTRMMVDPSGPVDGVQSDTEPIFGLGDFQAEPMKYGNSNQGSSYLSPGGFGTSGVYSSSLGAIHDAHMGNAYYTSVLPQPNGYLQQPTPQPDPMQLDSEGDTYAIDPALFSLNGRSGSGPNGYDGAWTGLNATLPQPAPRVATNDVRTAPAAALSPPVASTSASKLVAADRGAREKSTPPPVPSDFDRPRWKQGLPALRADLDLIQRAPLRTVDKLTKTLSAYANGEVSKVPIEGRIEVLAAIKKTAGHEFYKGWATINTKKGLEVTQAWLKGMQLVAEKGMTKDAGNEQDREPYMLLLLEFCDRLPITYEMLKEQPFLAKVVKRVNNEKVAAKYPQAVRDLAAALELKWRTVVEKKQQTLKDVKPAVAAPSGDAKRKAEAPPPPSDAGTKKRKVEVTKTLATTAKPSATDSLFETRVIPDKKLPSFNRKGKVPVVVAAPVPAPAAAPLNVMSPFDEAMASLKGRPLPTTEEIGMAAAKSAADPSGKQKKRVHWPAETQLASIKVVQRVVYEGEDGKPWHISGSAKDLERAEGQSLKLHDDEEEQMQEEAEWRDPGEVELGKDVAEYFSTAAPLESKAAEEQEEREKVSLSAIYFTEDQIPVSPAEPAEADAQPLASADLPRFMKLESTMASDPSVMAAIAEAQIRLSEGAPMASDDTVRSILAKLQGTSGAGLAAGLQAVTAQPASQPVPDVSNLLSNLRDSGMLSSLLQQAPPASAPSTSPAYGLQRNPGWGNQGAPLSSNPWETAQQAPRHPQGPRHQQGGAGRGRGSARPHRGANYKSQICRHYSSTGSCPFGDNCTYIHQ